MIKGGNMKRAIIILLLLFALTSCLSCATEYKSLGRTGGYGETKIDENTWKVYFSVNRSTSEERASDYLLLRCAELAKENGFSYFQVSDSESNPSRTISKNGNDIETIEKPTKSCTIYCFKDMPKTGTVYKANFIFKSIKDKYNLP
jgi:hypothetical protein